MAELILGPLWTLSVWVFCLGITGRIIAIFVRGFSRDHARARNSALPGSIAAIVRRNWQRPQFRQAGAFVLISGYMFHLGLLVLLFFAEPHAVFIEQHILGFGWPAVPHWAFILAAEFAFAGLLLLWLRRFVHPVVRLLSTRDNHVAAGLTFFAMLTGCLALLEYFEALRVLHVFAIELLMLYFPFSSLMHTFTIFMSRGSSGALAGRRGAGI